MPEFPGWSRNKDFVEAYRSAVRTRYRVVKRVPKHPPIVLHASQEYGTQALKALREGLLRYSRTRGTVPCAAYAFVQQPPATRGQLITEIAASLRKNAPQEMGKLRLPTYDLVTHSTGDGGDAPLPGEVYARMRPGGEPVGNGEGSTVSAGVFTVRLASLLQLARRLQRYVWEWRWTLRLAYFRRFRTLWPEGNETHRCPES